MEKTQKVIVSKTASGYAIAVLVFVGTTVKAEQPIVWEPQQRPKSSIVTNRDYIKVYVRKSKEEAVRASEMRKKQILADIKDIRTDISEQVRQYKESKKWIGVNEDTWHKIAADKLINRILITKA